MFLGQHLPHPFGLDLYGDEVFWTDWEAQSIQAANKYTGKNRRTLGSGVEGLMDVRVFHKERQSHWDMNRYIQIIKYCNNFIV